MLGGAGVLRVRRHRRWGLPPAGLPKRMKDTNRGAAVDDRPHDSVVSIAPAHRTDTQRPDGGSGGRKLAAAVTRAGGLGMIGVGSAGSRDLLEREVVHPQGLHLRFGIGLLDWASARDPELLETAIAAGPVLISVSFGDDWSWVSRVKAAGIAAATQISNMESAVQAADAGIDVIVARGAEGGGHGEPVVGTLPLLEEVLDAVAVPVLSAGGYLYGPRVGGSLGCGSLWCMDGDGIRRMFGVL